MCAMNIPPLKKIILPVMPQKTNNLFLFSIFCFSPTQAVPCKCKSLPPPCNQFPFPSNGDPRNIVKQVFRYNINILPTLLAAHQQANVSSNICQNILQQGGSCSLSFCATFRIIQSLGLPAGAALHSIHRTPCEYLDVLQQK